MMMDLFIARTMVSKVSLVFRGPIEITGREVALSSVLVWFSYGTTSTCIYENNHC